MGRGDKRRSAKMRRKRAQRSLKLRRKRQLAVKKTGNKNKK